MMTNGKAIYGFSAVMGLAFLGVLGVPTEPAGAIENYDRTNEQMGSDDPNAACKDKHAPCSDKSSFTMLQSYQMASKTLASVDNDLDSDQIKPQQLAEAEKKYADLAEKCVANESALSANVIRAVDGMKRELGAVWMYINTTHIADVSRSSHSLQRYNKCNSDMKQALDVGGVVRNWMDATTQAETQHNNCKAGEALLYDVMVDAKSSMETAILASKADECTKQFLPSKLFNPKPKVECIKKVVKWAERSNKSLVEAYAKFLAANEGHETKRNECTTMQHQFEAKFCEFSTAYKDACSARTACENAARKDYDQMKAEVKKTMQIRKSDFVAATHIDCYLGVILLAHNAENGVGLQGKLKECQNRVIDTSELDLVVVDLPENTPCDMTPTAPEPGETGWAKERYENKEWYEKASPIDSVVCIPTLAPTTIPTQAPPTPAPPTPAPPTPAPPTPAPAPQGWVQGTFRGWSGYTRIYKTRTNCNSPALPATSSEPVTLFANRKIRIFSTMVNSETPCFEAEYTLGNKAEITSKRLINAFGSGMTEAPEHVGDRFRRSNHGNGYGGLYFDPASSDTTNYLACGQMYGICGAGSWTGYNGNAFNEVWGEAR